MARSTRQLAPSSGTLTQTLILTVDNPSSSSSSSHQNQEETLVLKLKPKPKPKPNPKKKVTWREDTVDNEFLNKKSSKKCCIFHKEKPFDEDDRDDEDCERSPNGNFPKSHSHNCDHGHSDGCGGAGASSHS